MAGELLGLRAHFHLIAIAVALSGSWLASSAIRAANFDSDCCADLELRVAELEATTARKGNKKVSVQVYGKINRMVEFWDDAAEKNTYVTNNSYSPTRFGIRGTAKVGGDWSSGYRLEIEDSAALSKKLNQIDDDSRFGEMNVRHSFLFLKSEKLGEVRLGLTWIPKDDITPCPR